MSSIQSHIAIASRDPITLSKFYLFAINGEPQPGLNQDHCRILCKNGVCIDIYRPAKNRPWPDKGRAVALCLQKEPSIDPLISIDEWAKRLISRGATFVEEPEVQLFGAESWLTDPEGNYFLIFVPNVS